MSIVREKLDSIALARRHLLMRWYRRAARPLPWRGVKDPYRVWVSEVMLQQTQVATVIPYYARFLRAFPTAERLARASFEDVASRWSGLGYYRRARHLHLAAQKIVKEFGGRFPETYEAARKLPGVGRYTACAVLSIAYDKPLPVLDGNVARVVSRFEALEGHVQQAVFRSAVESRLRKMIPARHPGDFNQAMMELGQTVCLPRAPRCLICPIRETCRAFRRGDPEAYPEARPSRATERRYLATAIIRKGGKFALTLGMEEGLLADLWNFPSAFGGSSEEAVERLKLKLAAKSAPRIRIARKLGAIRHTITFRSIRVELYEVVTNGRGDWRWFSSAGINHAAVSALAKKIAAAWKQPSR